MDTAARERLRRVLRHDLRGHLAVILGRCELLQAGVGGDLAPAQLRSVDAIARAAERLRAELDGAAELLDAPEKGDSGPV